MTYRSGAAAWMSIEQTFSLLYRGLRADLLIRRDCVFQNCRDGTKDTSGGFSALGSGLCLCIHKTEAGSSQPCSRSYRACPSASEEMRDGLKRFGAAGNCESLTLAAVGSQLLAIRNDEGFATRQ